MSNLILTKCSLGSGAVASGQAARVLAGTSPSENSSAASKTRPLRGWGTKRIALRTASAGGDVGRASAAVKAVARRH
jgi:hypothetical protein